MNCICLNISQTNWPLISVLGSSLVYLSWTSIYTLSLTEVNRALEILSECRQTLSEDDSLSTSGLSEGCTTPPWILGDGSCSAFYFSIFNFDRRLSIMSMRDIELSLNCCKLYLKSLLISNGVFETTFLIISICIWYYNIIHKFNWEIKHH